MFIVDSLGLRGHDKERTQITLKMIKLMMKQVNRIKNDKVKQLLV
jgi:hypothetical protein